MRIQMRQRDECIAHKVKVGKVSLFYVLIIEMAIRIERFSIVK